MDHNITSLTVSVDTSDNFVSDRASFYVIVVVQVFLSGSIGVFGMVTNSLNIIVFIRQGVLVESSNVSLLGLAIADFFCVMFMLWMSITHYIYLSKITGLRWDPYDVMYATAVWPRLIATSISRGLTVFVALERCVCVVFPFKVRLIFSPKVSIISVFCIFGYFIFSYSPAFLCLRFQNVKDPDTNITRLVLIELPDYEYYDSLMDFINTFALNYGTTAAVLFLTAITVSRVQLSRTWRAKIVAETGSTKDPKGGKSGSDKQKDNDTKSGSKMQKEKRLIRMITSISGIFLICSVPNVVFLILQLINDEIRIGGRYMNLVWIMLSLIFVADTISSSINIIPYYKMSTKYRLELNNLFGIQSK